jgi:DNA-binding IclR family transcriptional regulator
MTSSARDPLARAFQLLRWMSDERLDSIGVREAAVALSVAPSTAHNLLDALAEEGVLQRDELTRRYALGMTLFHLAHQSIDRIPLRRVVMPHLRRLVSACNEAAHLSLYVRERAALVTIAGVESSQPVRYVLDMYSWRPLDVGAAGRAVLAFLPESERAPVFAQNEPQGPQVSDLLASLDAVKARGYALTRGTRMEGAVGLAAPLFSPSGQVLGAIGIALPEQRFDESDVERLSKPLIACARGVTDEIGASTLPSASLSATRRRPLPAKAS